MNIKEQTILKREIKPTQMSDVKQMMIMQWCLTGMIGI